MKKNLLIAALAIFGCANMYAQEASETVTERLEPTADTYLRMGNTADNGGKTTMEIWTSTDEELKFTNDFVGLMSFSVPVKPGYDVAKATLVLHADMVKGDPKFAVYPFDYTFAENDTYEKQAANVESARAEEAIAADISLNGWRGHNVGDVKADTDEKYKTADGWKTEIDITSYVAPKTDGYVGLLFYQDAGVNGTNGRSVKIYTKEAEDVVNETAGFTLKADDIKPYLLVEYTRNNNTFETYSPTADTFVRSSAAGNKYGTDDVLEIWTSSDGTDFAGLMSFTIPEKAGSEIAKATLVLHAERVKGDRKLTIYPFGYAISEGDDTWNTQGENVKKAREGEPIAEEVLNGQSGKAVTQEDVTDEYKTADAWKTEFDITEHVASIGSGVVNLLLSHNGENNNQNVKVYTKEVNDVTLNDGVTVFKADDLKPRLIVEYTTATGINEVATGETAVKGKEGIYTLSGVRVAKADRPGVYIINGKKVLVRSK